MIAALTAGAAVCSFGAAYLTNQVLPVRPLRPAEAVSPPTDAAPLVSSVGGKKTDLPPPPAGSRTARARKGV